MSALDPFAVIARWVAWCNEPRGSKGKLTKVPYGARGRKAKADDPATWIERAEAESRAVKLVNGSGGGIGIELGDIGNDLYLGGLDLDSCIDESGTLAPWAEPILAAVDTYAEVSPSGRGIKSFFLILVADVRPFLDRIGVDAGKWGTKRGIEGLNGADHGPGIEIYLSHRFFAVTGRLFPGKPDHVATLDQESWARLAALLPAARDPDKKTTSDKSRSAKAFREGLKLRRQGKTFEEMCSALVNHTDPDIVAWGRDKGEDLKRHLRMIWDKFEPNPTVVATARQTFDYLNNRYFVLNEAGKVSVGEFRLDGTFKTRREVLDRISFADFRNFYLNRYIKTGAVDKDGNDQSENLAQWWLRHPQRRQYDGVVFDPSGRPPAGCLNLWRGFGVDPAPGDWGLMRQHILTVICRNDPVVGDYFLNWLARMVQHPDEPGEVALVIRSDEEGTGKGILHP
jgi:hypothetical protein